MSPSWSSSILVALALGGCASAPVREVAPVAPAPVVDDSDLWLGLDQLAAAHLGTYRPPVHLTQTPHIPGARIWWRLWRPDTTRKAPDEFRPWESGPWGTGPVDAGWYDVPNYGNGDGCGEPPSPPKSMHFRAHAEAGALVAGLESRLFLKAAAGATLILVNQTTSVDVARVVTDADGIAIIPFTPRAGQHYYVQVPQQDPRVTPYERLEVSRRGCVMSATAVADGTVAGTVTCSDALSIRVLAHTSDGAVSQRLVVRAGVATPFTLLEPSAKPGRVRVAVIGQPLDEVGPARRLKVFAERWLYRNAGPQVRVKVEVEPLGRRPGGLFHPRDGATIVVTTTDLAGKPVDAELVVAVTAASDEPERALSGATLAAELSHCGSAPPSDAVALERWLGACPTFGDRWNELGPLGDLDGDQVIGAADHCPGKRRWGDGVPTDEHGCHITEPYRDVPPIADDRCPFMREDLDGVADTDGCPEDDADADNVRDASDLCPEDLSDACAFGRDPGFWVEPGDPDFANAVRTTDPMPEVGSDLIAMACRAPRGCPLDFFDPYEPVTPAVIGVVRDLLVRWPQLQVVITGRTGFGQLREGHAAADFAMKFDPLSEATRLRDSLIKWEPSAAGRLTVRLEPARDPALGLLGFTVGGDAKTRATPRYRLTESTLPPPRDKPDLRPTLYWNPRVMTGPTGRMTLRFAFGDALTNYRVLAEGRVVIDGVVHYVSGETRVATTKR